jgi:ubiquinone/menaquinone biosynthesis C-methylase UbiE
MHRKTELFLPPKKRMLHVAPEECLVNTLRSSNVVQYISADLSPRAMLQMDLMETCFPDETFDAIYASHVLEHIVDDRKAMREIFRVLKTGGWAILQVPVNGEVTCEDPAITDPIERERIFGQSDHVRVYGNDYYDRLSDVGFVVLREKLPLQQNATLAKRLGLFETDEITFCAKA